MDQDCQKPNKIATQQQPKASLTLSQQIHEQRIKSFILKNHKDLSKQFKALQNQQQIVKIHILHPNEIVEAACQIKCNRLVAFPTETVFGLGANALNQKALLDIYKTKRRPLTDPIIVHVLDFDQAKKLIHITPQQEKLALILTKKFWPGPLTIIFKANLQILPSVVTAQTGFVGIRSPKHPLARALIKQAGLPIGAPSANLFAHVSPTSAVHVFNDFYDQNISLIDGDRCEFGIQSTVTKIVEDEITKKISIYVLREGSLSFDRLKQFVQQVHLGNNLEVPQVILSKKIKSEKQNMQAPGQLLKHYSPYLPCFSCSDYKEILQGQKLPYQLNSIAIMAFSKQFQVLKDKVKYYFQMDSKNPILQSNQNDIASEFNEQNLFCSQQERIAMKNLYFMLRHCENLDCEAIVVCWAKEKSGTIWDKVFRATQGKEFKQEKIE